MPSSRRRRGWEGKKKTKKKQKNTARGTQKEIGSEKEREALKPKKGCYAADSPDSLGALCKRRII